MSYTSFQQVLIAINNESDEQEKIDFTYLDNINTISVCAKALDITYEKYKKFEKYNKSLCDKIDNIFKNEFKLFIEELDLINKMHIEKLFSIDNVQTCLFNSIFDINKLNNYQLFEDIVRKIMFGSNKLLLSLELFGIFDENKISSGLNDYNKKLQNKTSKIYCDIHNYNSSLTFYYEYQFSNKIKNILNFVYKMRNFI